MFGFYTLKKIFKRMIVLCRIDGANRNKWKIQNNKIEKKKNVSLGENFGV
jgi:hypothetical protein